MKINIKGKGSIELNKKDFIAQGGEGAVYAKSTTAYKLYCNDEGKFTPEKMIDEKKIKELSSISNTNIIKPEDILSSGRKNIGYTMRYVKNTYALCQTFTKAFKKRNNLSPDDMVYLTKQLQELVENAHASGALIVDLNEMNFLVSDDFKDVYAIDVDSWQTKSFPATAIMDSIRDRKVKNNKFTQESDWFSFGIIAFQMMIGIHPYKGKHATIKDIDTRMKKNISVFNKDVTLPKVCMPLKVIPKDYLKWFEDIFENGKRTPPPSLSSVQTVAFVPKVQKLKGTNFFDIELIKEYAEEILFASCNAKNHIILKDGVMCDDRKFYDKSPSGSILVVTDSGAPILAWIDNNKLQLFDLTKKVQLKVDSVANKLFVCDNNLFCKTGIHITHIDFTCIGGSTYVSQKIVANVAAKSSKVFDGVVMQHLLGNFVACICPTPTSSYQITIKELKGHRVVDAKFEQNVLMIVAEKSGKYDKYILRFDDNYKTYDCRHVTDVDNVGLNFTVLNSGLCVAITHDEIIEMFMNIKDNATLKLIDDKDIGNDMRLTTDGTKVLFTRDNNLYSMSMKQ